MASCDQHDGSYASFCYQDKMDPNFLEYNPGHIPTLEIAN